MTRSRYAAIRHARRAAARDDRRWQRLPCRRTDRVGIARVLADIRREGLERSQVMTAFDQFVTVIGPRLTGSPAHKAAADWATTTLTSWGLSDAQLEPWEFGRGWVLDRQVIEMIEPRYMPLIGYAEAWSAPTARRTRRDASIGCGPDGRRIAAMRNALAGAIVLTQPVQTAFVREDRPQPSPATSPVRIGAPPMPRTGADDSSRRRCATPGAACCCAQAPGSTAPCSCSGPIAAPTRMPTMVLAAEHYNMIARMVEKGVPVKLRVGIQSHYLTHGHEELQRRGGSAGNRSRC